MKLTSLRKKKPGKTFEENFENRFSKKIIQRNFIPVLEQLKILHRKEPENEVYSTLLKLINTKKQLSKNQLQMIIDDFKRVPIEDA